MEKYNENSTKKYDEENEEYARDKEKEENTKNLVKTREKIKDLNHGFRNFLKRMIKPNSN